VPQRSTTWDQASGRSLLNYPPHRFWDTERLRLSLTIADMNVPRIEATASLTMQAIDDNLSEITLDAAALAIEAVRLNGQDVPFTHDGSVLNIPLPDAFPRTRGREARVDIQYIITDPPDGLTWTPQSAPGDPAWPDRPPQLHTQGQPESNRYWVPMHDSPNERFICEYDIRVPAGFFASANGALTSHTTDARGERFIYQMRDPHPGYLMSLIVGKFDIVTLPPAGANRVPMRVMVPPGRAADVQRTYGRTGAMMDWHEKLLGIPYPWEKYDQLVVHNFGAGGMENTAVTTMFDTAVLSQHSLQDGDLDSLIAHELAHQWFGNVITCKSWEHIWLNEGWATFLDTLWMRDRPDGGSDDWYQWDLYSGLRAVLRDDQANAPQDPAMASKRWRHPWETFSRKANPYPKGAAVLHMLKHRLGEDLFWKGVQQYLRRHMHGQVETADFRRAMEAASGESLEAFFGQWVMRPGIPRVSIKADVDPSTGELLVTLQQTQPINADNPAFALTVPLWIRTSTTADWTIATITFDTRQHEARITLPASTTPTAIVIDPDMASLANYDLDMPLAWIERGMLDSPTLIGRLHAARAMLHQDRIEPVLKLIADDRAFWGLRVGLLHELATVTPAALLDDQFSARSAADARVRRAWAEALGTWFTAEESSGLRATDAARAAGAKALAPLVADPSDAVRAAVARALGQSLQPSAIDPMLTLVSVPSQHDAIRRGVMEGLRAMGEAARTSTTLSDADRAALRRALAAAIATSAPGNVNRTRGAATDALGALGWLDPDATFTLLSQRLTDRETRTSRAAAGALVNLADPRAVDLLTTTARTPRLTPAGRERLLDQAADLREKLAKLPAKP
jgi:aminopeptidase N